MKTIKQIADELGLPKQKVYRYIKNNHIKESHQKNSVMYYDDAVVNLIKSKILGKTVSSESHHEAHQNHINDAVGEAVIELLKTELESKNKQINELQSELNKEREHNREKDKQLIDTFAKLADSQAALTAGQTAEKQKALVEKMVEVQERKEDQTIIESNKKNIFNKFFRK